MHPNQWLRLGAVAAALSLVSCVPSLHPLYTQAELAEEPELPGSWVQAGTSDQWFFELAGPKLYRLRYSSKDSASSFRVAVVKLGTHRFLDLYPLDRPGRRNEVEIAHFVPAHNFARLKLKGAAMELAMLDNDWLKAALEKQRFQIEHALLDDGVVLTAPTADVQALVLKAADIPEAFQKPIELKRGAAQSTTGVPAPKRSYVKKN